MNVNVITSASVFIHHALEEAPLLGMTEFDTLDPDIRMIGSVNPTRLLGIVSLHYPIIHRDDAGRTGIDGSDCEPAHPGEQVDEGDRLHVILSQRSNTLPHLRHFFLSLWWCLRMSVTSMISEGECEQGFMARAVLLDRPKW